MVVRTVDMMKLHDTMAMSGWKIGFVCFLFACAASAAVGATDGDEEEAMTSYETFVKDSIEWMSAQNPAVFTIAMALWIALCLPSSVVEMLPAFVYGYWTGLAVSLVGKNLGNLIACFVSRYMFYGFFRKRLMEKYRFMLLLERAFKKGGFKIIALVRAMYLPMALKNYGFAVMDIPLHHIILAAIMTGLPFAAMWAYVGSSARSLSDLITGEARKNVAESFGSPRIVAVAAPMIICALYFAGKWINRIFQQVLEEERRDLARENNNTNEYEDSRKAGKSD